MPLDLRSMPAGVYLVRVEAADFTATQKAGRAEIDRDAGAVHNGPVLDSAARRGYIDSENAR